MLETNKSHSLLGLHVCVGDSFDIQAGNLQFCLNLHCICLQSLKVIQGWEYWTFSGFYLIWTVIWMHVVFKIFRNTSELFKSPMNIIPQIFLLSFCSVSCWPQLLSLPQACVMLNNCCWLSLTIASEEKNWFHFGELWVKSNKGKLGELGFPGNFYRGQKWQFSENDNCLRSSIPVLPSLVVDRLLIFTRVLSYLYSRVLWS